jgi:uncharacterized protein (DUF342 family)
MAYSAQPVALVVKGDGVYLEINKLDGRVVTRTEVMRVVEQNRIRDIDFAAISAIFKNNDSVFETLISRNTDILVTPETAKVGISPDKLSATVSFVPPVNCDTLLTFDKLIAILKENKVVFGIDEDELSNIFSTRSFHDTYVAARGVDKVDGVNGYVIYHFDTNPKTYRPRERGDGTVDYKQLDLIDIVNEGDLLVEGIVPVEGIDGINVLGKPIAHKPGKPHPVIGKTKNTYFSEDGHKLYAGASGQLVYKNGRVEIFPVLQISGDINNTTGNIDFVGSVVIAGNVLTGFTVKAHGNIEVHGVLEGGELRAGESVVLTNGAQGMERGSIYAKADIRAKYIDQCKVYAGGNIYTDFILYSRVKCNGRIELAGKKGLLLGGKATVKDGITANTIGADLSASTELELGFLPDDYEKYKNLLRDLEENMREYDKVESYEKTLNLQAQKGLYGNDLEKKRAQSNFSKSYYEGIIAELQEKINDLIPDCSDEETGIVVNKSIHSGVRITIGDAQTIIFENHGSCRVRNQDGKITITDL